MWEFSDELAKIDNIWGRRFICHSLDLSSNWCAEVIYHHCGQTWKGWSTTDRFRALLQQWSCESISCTLAFFCFFWVFFQVFMSWSRQAPGMSYTCTGNPLFVVKDLRTYEYTYVYTYMRYISNVQCLLRSVTGFKTPQWTNGLKKLPSSMAHSIG